MNTLTKLDTYVATYLNAPPKPPVGSPSKVPFYSPGVNTTSRLSNLPPTPRKNRRYRRTKPTSSSVKLPPPTTPLLLRVVLGLWSILLSFWTSLVVETRAERVKRRRRGPTVLQQLTGDIGSEAEAEGEGSASEIEGGIVSDDDWIDPVTRASVDEKVDEPDDEEFAPDRSTTPTNEKFTFRLRSAEKQDTLLPPSPPETPVMPKTFIQQPTPPSILSNPLPSPAKRKVSNRLLPNPIATKVLDPTVPAVPAPKTFTNGTLPSPRRNPTPFHLQKTLILDLDETLIHSTSRPISYAASAGGGLLGLSFGGLVGGRSRRREGHTVEVVLHGRSTTYHVYKRPHVDHFLKKVASWYTLVIYTASMPEYADPVIDWLDAGRGFFAKRLYRESCYLQTNGSYIKDLALVEADLSRVCFMDNSPISYSWNKANALPIEGWTSDPNDEALLQCIPVLDSLRFVNDVRRVLGIRGFS